MHCIFIRRCLQVIIVQCCISSILLLTLIFCIIHRTLPQVAFILLHCLLIIFILRRKTAILSVSHQLIFIPPSTHLIAFKGMYISFNAITNKLILLAACTRTFSMTRYGNDFSLPLLMEPHSRRYGTSSEHTS